MERIKHLFFIAGTALLLGVATPSMSAVAVFFDNSVSFNTTAVDNFQTTGADMNDMSVTFNYADGGSATLAWAATGLQSGGVFDGNVSLSLDGDTFSADWLLTTNRAIDNIFIDGGLGSTVFDTDFGGNIGTVGSAAGNTFSTLAAIDINVTYSGIVGVAGNPGVGDIWRYLAIDFVRDFGGPNGGKLSFLQDTDNLFIKGDLKPVPEPSTVLLLLIGLVFLIMARRRSVNGKVV